MMERKRWSTRAEMTSRFVLSSVGEEEKESESTSEWLVSGMDRLAVQSDENESEGSESDVDEISEMSAGELNVASLNVGQALSRKFQVVLSTAARLTLDVVALQEVGEPVNWARIALDFGYQMYVCEAKNAGVAL